MKIKINNEITQNVSDIITTEGTSLNDIISQVLLASHPVGSYYWSDDSTSPAKLFGGTWEQIKDKFIIAVGDNHTAGTSYGSNTKNLSHTHTSAAHTHTVAGHTHTSAAHTHTINAHTHTSAAHTHSINGHTHTTGSHSLTIAELPSHNHKSTTDLGCNGLVLYWDDKQSGENFYGAQWQSGLFKSSGAFALNNLYTSSTGSGTAHSHGNTGSTSLTTNSTTPGATGSTSLTTNSTTPGATGSTSLTTNSTTPGATGSSLSSSFDITPACIAAYCWRRTA